DDFCPSRSRARSGGSGRPLPPLRARLGQIRGSLVGMVTMRISWLPHLLLAILGLALLGSPPAWSQDQKIRATLGTIERLDPALDQLVPRNAVIEKLASGFAWSERPVWIPSGKFLLFSDIPNNTIFQWKEGAGITPFMKPAGYEKGRDPNTPPRAGEPGSNGLLLDPEGRLVLC